MPFAAIGGAIGGQILGSMAGNYAARSGAGIDRGSKLKHEAALWGRAQERGITAQEYYGSPAPGGPTGSSGAAQVMGNSQNAMAAELGKQQQQSSENQKDRDNQKEIAQIQAGTQTRGQDITAGTASNILDFQKANYLQTTLPQAAKNLQKSEQEVLKLINEVATSNPKFIKMLKIMTMGSDNSYGLAIQNMLGIDISDPKQMQSLSADMRRKLLAGLLSGGSTAAKELAGFAGSIEQWLDTMAQGGASLIKSAKDALKPNMQQTKPQLGNKKDKTNWRTQGSQLH